MRAPSLWALKRGSQRVNTAPFRHAGCSSSSEVTARVWRRGQFDYSQATLLAVARQLTERPTKTLLDQTPAEKLAEWLPRSVELAAQGGRWTLHVR